MRADDLFDLSGRVALVTGASSGLGARFATVLAANGASVVCAARRLDRLGDVVAEIEGAGGKACAVSMDVTDLDSVSAGLDAAEAAFGAPAVVCNNAGVTWSGRSTDMDDANWRRVVDINLDGVFRVAREAACRMMAAGQGGSIINTASILGLSVSRGLAAYSASKAGVVHLTQALAIEWGRQGIRVNALAPGYFQSEMTGSYLTSETARAMFERTPMKRPGAPHELDGALLLLASDAGSYINGAILPVDGGHRLEIPS